MLSEKTDFQSETEQIEIRYEKRKDHRTRLLYSPTDPYVMMVNQERERIILRWLDQILPNKKPEERTLLEIGCGAGGNLIRFLEWGFLPEKITGNDLLPDRLEEAGEKLSEKIQLIAGDAMITEFPEQSYDLVALFTVFSSILDQAFQEKLAERTWNLVEPGGGILWCDFIYNNPRNSDVKGVSIRRIKELFPEAKIRCKRVTLAPPIGRRVSRIHPSLYSLFNFFPFLRSHVLCWLEKEPT